MVGCKTELYWTAKLTITMEAISSKAIIHCPLPRDNAKAATFWVGGVILSSAFSPSSFTSFTIPHLHLHHHHHLRQIRKTVPICTVCSAHVHVCMACSVPICCFIHRRETYVKLGWFDFHSRTESSVSKGLKLIVWVGQAFALWSPPSRHEPYDCMARTPLPFFCVFEPSKL